MHSDLKKIEQIIKYVDLGKKLSTIVNDKHSKTVSEFINSLESYKNGLLEVQKQNIIYLTKTAEADRKMAGVESLVLKACAGDAEKAKKYMLQLSKPSHRQRYWRSVRNAVFYGVLSALFSPFSLEESRHRYSVYKNYASSAKTVAQTMKIAAHTDKLKLNVLRLKSETEKKDTQISTRLQQEGVDEKVADFVATNPESLVFAYFDYLKKEYDLP